MTRSGRLAGHQARLGSRKEDRQASRHLPVLNRRLVLPALLILIALIQTSCLQNLIDLAVQGTPTIIDVSFADPTRQTTSSGTEANGTGSTSATAATTTDPAAVTVVPTAPAADFARQVGQILLDGLRKEYAEISLDAAVRNRKIPESSVQETINRVYAIYRELYSRYADFYYLNGSINVSYTLLQGEAKYLESMTIQPQYWPILRDLTAIERNRLLSQVDAAADTLASQIRAETGQPWRQLLLLHDYLVRNIVYDSTGNQDTNQAISALLDHSTLCQGYAQAFQLIGQKLGIDVRLIGGEYEGVGHAWNLVCLDGQFYHVDVTHDDPTPDGGPDRPVEHVHFLRSDSQMQTTHSWETADYPACPSDGAFYYRELLLTANSRDSITEKLDQFISGIDFTSQETALLELLYTGSDLPDSQTLQAMLQKALDPASAGHTVYYRNYLSKGVVLVEITPG
ncbi:MAG TPA: hypothetical protein DD640_03605 [Clostridiales bacterium]|nr:hypothetical protein [Clostridiales bacterium]